MQKGKKQKRGSKEEKKREKKKRRRKKDKKDSEYGSLFKIKGHLWILPRILRYFI